MVERVTDILTAEQIRETRMLAEVDNETGHLTEFWYARIQEMCDRIERHRCRPSESLSQALNSGDGTYKP